MTETAIENLQKTLKNSKFDALALNPGPTLTYLTGLNFHLMERPVIFILAREGCPTLVLPELEKGKVAESNLQAFTYGDNPDTWQDVFDKVSAALALPGKKIGVEPTRLRFLELNILQQAAGGARFLGAEHILADLRMYKLPAEIEKMRRAVRIAEGSSLSAWQAEPVEAIICGQASNRRRPETPGNSDCHWASAEPKASSRFRQA